MRTAIGSPNQPSLEVGDICWCMSCRRFDRITSVYFDERFNYYFYGFGNEDPSKEPEGHTDDLLWRVWPLIRFSK